MFIYMTKSKASASSIVVPSIIVIHLVNGGQFLNVTWVTWCPVIVMSPFTTMKSSLKSQRFDFNNSVL